eukprot:6468469-Amphidinium_carterae.1
MQGPASSELNMIEALVVQRQCRATLFRPIWPYAFWFVYSLHVARAGQCDADLTFNYTCACYAREEIQWAPIKNAALDDQ